MAQVSSHASDARSSRTVRASVERSVIPVSTCNIVSAMETELAWAAGLFEGEGTVATCNGRRRLQVKMISESSVRRFHEAIGVGKMYGPYGPYKSQLGSKPIYLWIAEKEDRDIAILRLRPYVSAWVTSRFT